MRKKIIVLLCFAIPLIGFGVQPKKVYYSSLSNFVAGESEGITITESGELMLSPEIKKIFQNSRPFLYDMEINEKGEIFAATGDEALLLKIDSQGNLDTLFSDPEYELFAIAFDKKSNLFLALSPGALIYKLDKSGRKTLFADLPAKYIWDLKFDNKNFCYVATGDSGIVYKVNRAGEYEVFFNTDDLHARVLNFDNEHRLLVGTSNKGIIYRVDEQGNGFVLYDSDYEEVKEIKTGPEGEIYALGVNKKKTSATAQSISGKIPSESDKTKELVSLDTYELFDLPMKRTSTEVFSIDADGIATTIFKPMRNENIYTLAFMEGQLLIGTGEKGNLYSVDSKDRQFSLLTHVPSPQINVISVIDNKNAILGSSNLLAFYRLRKNHNVSGNYESPVIDGKMLSYWGEIQWQQQGKVNLKFYTRSGNSSKQDKFWSKWTVAEKVDEHRAKIKSPAARFLQWKISMEQSGQSTGKVYGIEISYKQKNAAPKIEYVNVQPFGEKKSAVTRSEDSGSSIDIGEIRPLSSSGKDKSSHALGTKAGAGKFRISWRSTDSNQDNLIYDIFIEHQRGNIFWKLKTDLTGSSYIWDSQTVPDGIYRIKLVASDKPSNSVNDYQTAEKRSPWFVVDHTPPVVRNLSMKKEKKGTYLLKFQAKDNLSSIRSAYFSIDGENWQWLNPVDGICDAQEESFDYKIKNLAKPVHVIVVKVIDEGENVGYGRLFLEE